MNAWVIGDLQGCCDELEALLAHPALRATPEAELWFAGDLVNRGPRSLDTLRRVIALGSRARSVLGNHDLHLLGVAAGARQPSRSDTLDPILNAPDADALLDWLRHLPLAHHADQTLMVHAGLLPDWDLQTVLALAQEVEAELRSPHWKTFLGSVFGNQPAAWHPDLTGADRHRLVINALTRIRFCFPDGAMEFSGKGDATQAPAGTVPWFALPQRKTQDQRVVFGHWSTLGLINTDQLIALDTGCVWGGELSALHLPSRQLVQIACRQHQQAD
ncbi:MAG: symmetrical bis(5'-nucleosyl)-tetraphosphatase [Pigmentiphaga sp.]|nr:symmetrical bis(5'-nucleosyl)-tetraphosphatase [Pigmentiphaga sp.]